MQLDEIAHALVGLAVDQRDAGGKANVAWPPPPAGSASPGNLSSQQNRHICYLRLSIVIAFIFDY
jgi:hypothetical protein